MTLPEIAGAITREEAAALREMHVPNADGYCSECLFDVELPCAVLRLLDFANRALSALGPFALLYYKAAMEGEDYQIDIPDHQGFFEAAFDTMGGDWVAHKWEEVEDLMQQRDVALGLTLEEQ